MKKINTTVVFVATVIVFIFSACGGGGGSDASNIVSKGSVYYYNWGPYLYGYEIQFTVETSDGAIDVGHQIIYTFDADGNVEGYNTKNYSTYYPTNYRYYASSASEDAPPVANIHLDYYGGAATEDYVLKATSATEGTFTYQGYNGQIIGEATGKYKILVDGGAPFVSDINATSNAVRLTFSEPLSASTVTTNNFSLYHADTWNYLVGHIDWIGDTPIDMNVSLEADGKTVLLQPQDPSQYRLFYDYAVTVGTGVKDRNDVNVKEGLNVLVQPRDLQPQVHDTLLTETAPSEFVNGSEHINHDTKYHFISGDTLWVRSNDGWCQYGIGNLLNPSAYGCIPKDPNSDFSQSERVVFYPNPNWANTTYFERYDAVNQTGVFAMQYASFGTGHAYVMTYDLRFLPQDGTYLENYYAVLGIYGKYLLLTTFDRATDADGMWHDTNCHINKIDITNLSSETQGERIDGTPTASQYDILLESRIAVPENKCYKKMTVHGNQAFLSGIVRDNQVRLTNFDPNTADVAIDSGTTADIGAVNEVVALNGIVYFGLHPEYITPTDTSINAKVYGYNAANEMRYLGDYNSTYTGVRSDGDPMNFEPSAHNTTHLYDNVYLNRTQIFNLDDPLHPLLVGGTDSRDVDITAVIDGGVNKAVFTQIMSVIAVEGHLYTFKYEYDGYGEENHYLEVTEVPQR